MVSRELKTGTGAAHRRIRVFGGVSAEDYSRITARIRWKAHERGTEVLAYGERSTDVYFVGSGHLRATMYSASGREVAYRDVFEGELFGELSALDGLPRSASVIAVERSEVGAMSAREFVDVVHAHPEVTDALLRSLVAAVRELTDRVQQFDTLGVKDRVRNEVLRLARAHMTGPNTAVIPQMPRHVDIANRIDTHREAVTRELNALSDLGLIRRNKRELTVVDVTALAQSLEEN